MVVELSLDSLEVAEEIHELAGQIDIEMSGQVYCSRYFNTEVNV